MGTVLKGAYQARKRVDTKKSEAGDHQTTLTCCSTLLRAMCPFAGAFIGFDSEHVEQGGALGDSNDAVCGQVEATAAKLFERFDSGKKARRQRQAMLLCSCSWCKGPIVVLVEDYWTAEDMARFCDELWPKQDGMWLACHCDSFVPDGR